MTDQDLQLYDAIRFAKEAEQKATTFYADGATKTANPMGKKLFEQLADFERYHYQKLTDLENSLRAQGKFIGYEGRELLLSPILPFDRKEKNRMSVMDIITTAMDLETKAGELYKNLALQTSDPDGKAMFERLAKEEQNHYRILANAFPKLNQFGEWDLGL